MTYITKATAEKHLGQTFYVMARNDKFGPCGFTVEADGYDGFSFNRFYDSYEDAFSHAAWAIENRVLHHSLN